jgi:hypothetical protein
MLNLEIWVIEKCITTLTSSGEMIFSASKIFFHWKYGKKNCYMINIYKAVSESSFS